MTLLRILRYLNNRCIMRIHPKHLSTCASAGSGGRNDSTPSDPDNPSAPSMYDCRKYGHNLPCDSVTPCFETLPNIPTGIFRCTYGEMLGRGANKCGYYRNPEYFSYQHMTFYDMHLILRPCRKPSPRSGRKP